MLKYFLILVGMFVSFPLYAMEEEDDDINVVIFSAKEEKVTKNLSLPTCDEQAMIDEVSDQIREYLSEHPEKGIIRRRKQILMLKNLKDFKEVAIENFDRKDNHEVSRHLIMTKINYRIKEEDMRLCRSGSDVYLLIYPEGHGYRVQLINFAVSLRDEEESSLLYVRTQPRNVDQAETLEPTEEVLPNTQVAEAEVSSEKHVDDQTEEKSEHADEENKAEENKLQQK